MSATPTPQPELPFSGATPALRLRWRRHPLLAFVLRRLAIGVVLVFIASLLIFAATNVLPGDAASAILGRLATPEALADLRAELGLDRPLHEQYLDWIGNLLSGDLGHSVTNQQPVSELIGYRVVNTLALALITAIFLRSDLALFSER